MTEPATPKPFITRRRVIAGAVGVLVIVGVMGVGFGVFGGNDNRNLELKFVRFEKIEGQKAPMGVFEIINHSKRRLSFNSPDNFYTVESKFFVQTVKGKKSRYIHSAGLGMPHELKPSSAHTCYAWLPLEGVTGRVGVEAWVYPRSLSGPSRFIRGLWWSLRTPAADHMVAICNQMIQSPKVLPDGTVEPPRLLPDSDAKP